MLLYWAMRIAFALSRRVPLSVQYALGMAGGEAVYWLWPSKRRNARRNMAVLSRDGAGSRRAEALARASFRNYGRYIIDFLKLPSLSPADVVSRVQVEGWENLDRALAIGKGVIFVAGHFGTYDYAPIVVADRYPGRVYVVAEPFASAKMDGLVQGERAAKGSTIVPMTSVRRMVRILRNNDILALLVDRPVHGDGVPVQFFGRCTMVPAGAATLAAMTGATLLPGYLIHRRSGSYDGCILPPIEFVSSGDRAADVRRATQSIFTSLERMILRSPAHWYMFRDMWAAPASAVREVEALA